MPDVIQSGSLPRPSLYEVFRGLDAAKATGVLHLEHDSVRRTIHFENGRIRFATTNQSHERLGAEAVRQHLATWWQVQEAAQRIAADRRLGTVMVDEGILSGEEQARLVRDQLRQVVVSALGWREGRFHFEPGPLQSGESILLDWSVADAILEEARRTQDQEDLMRALGGLRGYLKPSPQGIALPRELNATEKRVLAAVNGRQTVPEITRLTHAPEEMVLRTLAGLVRAGCLVAPAAQRHAPRRKAAPAPARSQAAATAAAPPAPAGGRYAMKALNRSERFRPEKRSWVMSPEIRSERAAILELADQVHRLDHYQLLGVRPHDSRQTIAGAFAERARRFHPDRRLTPGLGNLGDELERVYDALRIAYQTLEDPESRAEYDGRRERDHRAAEDIKRANKDATTAYMHTASQLIQRGALPDAIPVLLEALRTGPGCALAHFRLGQCLAATLDDPARARYHFERAVKLEPANPRFQAALASLRAPDPAPRRGLAGRLARWLHL